MVITASLLLILSLAGHPPALAEWEAAIRSNHTDTLRVLHHDRADVDEATDHGKTALMAAAAAGDAELVDDLLERGADPAATNRLGGSVLMYAVSSGSAAVVERLLERSVPLDAQASNGWSAIMMAAAKDLDGLITRLAAAGANPNTSDIYGWTPLMRAIFEGHRSAVAALLDLPEIDLDQVSRIGQNALHLAVIAGHAELTGELVSRNVAQVSDHLGQTPRAIARDMARDDLLTVLGDDAGGTELDIR